MKKILNGILFVGSWFDPVISTIKNWLEKYDTSRQIQILTETILEKQHTNIIVSQGGQYPTINSALKVAKSGDRIFVKTGLYKECVVLNKTVELIADGSPIIESTTHCIKMQTDYAIVKGFTIHCKAENKGNYDSDSAVYIPRGRLLLESCDVTSSGSDCIEIRYENARATIKSCKIHDAKMNAIWILEQGYAEIEDCDIFGSGYPQIAIDGGNATIRRCKIHDGKQNGIWVCENGMGQIEDCDIFGNTYSGIEIKTGGNPTVRRCKITNNGGRAIWVKENGKATVENCDLRGNRNGAWLIDKTSQVQKRNNQE